nr:zinc knuckle CX2CX4HX4C [Tanacetum cinerariifolium]
MTRRMDMCGDVQGRLKSNLKTRFKRKVLFERHPDLSYILFVICDSIEADNLPNDSTVQFVDIQDKPSSYVGLKDVLENGPWMICNSPIIKKKWTINSRLCKEELTRIPVWAKIHDVPIQVFLENGLSIIASQIGKPIMLDSYTSSMCIESWRRSSFALCLIKVNANDVLIEILTTDVPLINEPWFTIETKSIEYEWKPPCCDLC